MPTLAQHVTNARLKTAYLGSHFAPAFFLLSPERRAALKTLYAVCRILDDAVDKSCPTPAQNGAPNGGVRRAQESPHEFLDAWKKVFEKKEAEAVHSFGQSVLAANILKVAKDFDIPNFVFMDLIDRGVRVDLMQNRFRTPMDTEGYFYGVAGTVGLACVPIFGVPLNEAKDFAIRLGIAVQWVNAIRDVGVDAKMGRIYIPLEHLGDFGYTEDDLLASRDTPSFRALMNNEARVARMNFKRALELMPRKWAKELIPARVMGQVYSQLLEKIEKKGFPVLRSNIRLNLFEKAWAAIKVLRHQ